MGKKQCAAMAAVGVVMFAAGFLVRMAWDGHVAKQEALAAQAEAAEKEALAQQDSQTVPEASAEGYLDADMIQVRIEDNQVQWYDGRLWHEVASVDELQMKDRFYLASEAFREFDEQLRQEKADARQAVASGEAGEKASGALSVGVKEAAKTEQRTQSKPSAPKASAPGAGSSDNGGGSGESSGGGNSDGGDFSGGDSDEGNSGGGSLSGGNSGGGSLGGGNSGGEEPPVAPPPAEEPSNPGDSGSSTGDGENMEWSDDYL